MSGRVPETYRPGRLVPVETLALPDPPTVAGVREAAAYVAPWLLVGDGPEPDALLALFVAMARAVEARCAHVAWPPSPDSRGGIVACRSRAVTCGRSACIAAARRRWNDDGRCSVCELEADAFRAIDGRLGPYRVLAQLCSECAALFAEGGA